MSFGVGTSISAGNQAMYGIKIPHRQDWELKASRQHKLCATIWAGKSAPEVTTTGKIYYALGQCFQTGTGTMEIAGSSGWEIAGREEHSDCWGVSFSETAAFAECDHAFFGFSYDSGQEGEAREFYVTWRWDIEGQTF